jgi:Holliday junction resolvase RusA-like endonuclease
MITLRVKPISLNSAYRGRRFSTPELDAFKESVTYLLPQIEIPDGKLAVKYIFGTSSKNSDGDNLIKCFQDALAKKYGFNDKMIYKWEVEKIDCKKGEEFIEFEINQIIEV